MRRTVDLDLDLANELDHVSGLIKEKPAVVIRQALRIGLPLVASRLAPPRPEGYFADAYRKPDPERLRFESSMAKVKQRSER